jgi:dTDP-4-dehydrorhamnose reductase
MNYLITGRNGQLASEFLRRLETRGAQVTAPDEASFDITDAASVEGVVSAAKPGVILNCAAYNLVDQAEQDRGRAFRVNADGPKHLAESAERNGAMLVHFGSDYVFNGDKTDGLYVEEDRCDPLNEYGRSKLAGERAVQEVLGEQALVFRLSWVFGAGRQNFIHKFLERARSGDTLKVTCDEFSVPTWTATVVDAVLRALERGLTGLYHLTNSGYCSRYEWAKLILRSEGIERFILPVSMESFRLPARRPKFSAMSNGRAAKELGIDIPAWEEAVADFIRQKGSL